MRFQFGQIDYNHTVIKRIRLSLHVHIGCQIVGNGCCPLGHIITSRSTQISGHVQIEREKGSRGTHLGSHITDRRFPRRRQGCGTGTEIFDDGIRPTLHSEDSCQFQDHVLRRCPSAQATSQFYTYQFRHFQLPFHTCHHIHSVSAAYTDGNHPQTTRIWRMRVRTNHHTAGKSIVLKHYLMDNAGSRFPETDTVLVGNGF